jgi:WD40 repeat protein
VQLWEVATRKLRTTLEGPCDCIAFSPDGKFLATNGAKGGVKLRNADTGATAATLPCDESSPRRLAFSPDGKKLLVGTNQGIQLWDVTDRKCDWKSPRSLDVSALAYAPDGKRVASGDYAGRARVWDAVTGEEIDDCQVTTAYVTALAFAPDGRSLVVGSGHYFNERGLKLTFDGYPARVWKPKK